MQINWFIRTWCCRRLITAGLWSTVWSSFHRRWVIRTWLHVEKASRFHYKPTLMPNVVCKILYLSFNLAFPIEIKNFFFNGDLSKTGSSRSTKLQTQNTKIDKIQNTTLSNSDSSRFWKVNRFGLCVLFFLLKNLTCFIITWGKIHSTLSWTSTLVFKTLTDKLICTKTNQPQTPKEITATQRTPRLRNPR